MGKKIVTLLSQRWMQDWMCQLSTRWRVKIWDKALSYQKKEKERKKRRRYPYSYKPSQPLVRAYVLFPIQFSYVDVQVQVGHQLIGKIDGFKRPALCPKRILRDAPVGLRHMLLL